MDRETTPFRPSIDNASLLVIDVQEKFRPAIPCFDRIAGNVAVLARAFGVLGMPVFATEQYPKGLGPTVADVASALPADTKKITKKSFSCCGEGGLLQLLMSGGRPAVALCGVETHVCVCQTALDLLAGGFTVMVAADAAGSRKTVDHETALRRMERSGAVIVTVEMLLFDLLRTADSPHFREIQNLVK
jgi:nicotinamidase-related amidase